MGCPLLRPSPHQLGHRPGGAEFGRDTPNHRDSGRQSFLFNLACSRLALSIKTYTPKSRPDCCIETSNPNDAKPLDIYVGQLAAGRHKKTLGCEFVKFAAEGALQKTCCPKHVDNHGSSRAEHFLV